MRIRAGNESCIAELSAYPDGKNDSDDESFY